MACSATSAKRLNAPFAPKRNACASRAEASLEPGFEPATLSPSYSSSASVAAYRARVRVRRERGLRVR